MSVITAMITKENFKTKVFPQILKTKKSNRGRKPKISYHKHYCYMLYKAKTGCQWDMLPIENEEITPNAVHRMFDRWSERGVFSDVFESSVGTLQKSKPHAQLSEINLDGTHSLAKNGGEEVAYQFRKKGQTRNLLYCTNASGKILGISKGIAGNHNDLYEIKKHVDPMLKLIKSVGYDLKDVLFQADKGFDSQGFRKFLQNRGLKPNIDENQRNRKGQKRGRKRFFDKERYNNRFTNERTFAWMDGFKNILIRFDKKVRNWLAWNQIAAANINFNL